MTLSVKSLIYHLARLSLGGIFVYAGWIKAVDVTAFAGSVANYQILPYSWNFLVAATLPYVEILAGVLLLLNQRVRPAALVIGGLNLVFIIVLATVIARGLDIDCGCFNPGGEGTTTAFEALVRDLGIMVLVVATWWLRTEQTRKPG
ncbi:MauE/DoxX family redox-associated membrane protein [Geoalkalibacter halelectricus]|uniref:DoxX family membrane protein n=1 Tax=Geoalkalibacter halelectricus TaxID=2847045 RepID=A0ABY5ZT93_9BACT|nr:MauE/DoxX family redox-associated membrane protein [Geoalkalibacter halelectricus]MDO3377351.1 DoxX family membrane protein [Geoalkalibacter halelectricus]UWZ80884.1 DoxX family membrane protein [Geoalkalibacter halelectricus]